MNCRVMGIVNVTPDSFSDGGKFFKPEEAIRRAKNLIEEGADIIDLGGESTRPGATPIGWEEEWERLDPVISGLSAHVSRLSSPVLSVDTYHPETAERALRAGVKIVNCVYSEPIPEMLRLLEHFPEAELVLPSRLLTNNQQPTTNNQQPATNNQQLTAFLPRLYLDPLIGFGTTREEDLAILRTIPELAKRGRVLIGASRKRIVKRLTGEKVPGKDLAGNLTIAIWAALGGASVVRVHDVHETVQSLKVLGVLTSNPSFWYTEGTNG